MDIFPLDPVKRRRNKILMGSGLWGFQEQAEYSYSTYTITQDLVYEASDETGSVLVSGIAKVEGNESAEVVYCVREGYLNVLTVHIGRLFEFTVPYTRNNGLVVYNLTEEYYDNGLPEVLAAIVDNINYTLLNEISASDWDSEI